MQTLERENSVKEVNMEENNKKEFIKNYLNSQSYQKDFVNFMVNMLDKYGVEIFNLNGIGEQLDMNKAIKKAMSSSTMADTSVDPNSNTNIITSGAVFSEVGKAHSLIHNHYRVWKFMKKSHDLEYANDLMERKLTGQIYIHDFSSFLPYSYYGKTVITVKYRGQILYLNMEDLFNMFENSVEVLPDRETIDLSNVNIYVLDKGNKFVKLTRVLRHKSHCGLLKFETKNGRTTIVTEDHPVILENGEEKQASAINIGDRLMISDCSFDIFDSGCHDIDRTKYLVGFTLGDGHLILGGTRGSNQLSIKQKDLENHKVYQYIKEESPTTANNLHDGGNGTQRVSFGTKCWVCKNAQINHGAPNKVFPKDVLNWDKNEVLSFIAGLIDSDGCVNSQNGVVDVRITAFSAVQQMAEILRSLGFERVRTSLMDTQKREYQFGSNYDMYRVSFVVDDKNIDLVNFSDKLQKHKDVVLKERGKDGRFETNEVLKIRSFEQDYVYDITTETGTFSSQGLIQHNCFNFDPVHFALLGIPKELDGKGESLPPQHMESFFGILEDILPIFAKNLAGACGIATLFPVLSIYVQKAIKEGYKIDKIQLKDEQAVWDFLRVKLTSLLYNLNRPSRDGSQSLFTNVSIMSPSFLEEVCANTVVVFKNDVVITADVDITLKIQDLWVDVFNEESKRRLFTFPVQTLSIATVEDPETGKQKIVDEDFYNKMMAKNSKLASQNVYAGDSSTLSSCCRLRSDKSKIFTNSLGGSTSNIGSFGVCTINLATLGLRYKDNLDKFYEELEKNIRYAQEVNRCKMNFIKKDIKRGALPMYTLGFVSLDKQYATLGINGLYECCVELGKDYRELKNRSFVEELLQFINKINDDIGENTLKHIVNCEQVPAENVAVKLAKIDNLLGYNTNYEIYANQFIPLDVTTEGGILDRVSIQGELDKYFSGGSILHANLDQECDEQSFIDLGKYAIENGVRYFGINYVTCKCHNCEGTFVGKFDKCPHCGSEDFEAWCRIIGYMVPISNYNAVRRKKFNDRIFYKSINN